MATTIITKNGSGAPTADDLSVGELAVDLTNKRLYSKNSSSEVIELGVNAAADTTFGDNVKAIFGAGSDLQIYHDATDSIINDNGTGSLKLQQGGSTKLEVTTTGIDVTGTVTADGLTVDGSGSFVASANDSFLSIAHTGTEARLSATYTSTGSWTPIVLRTQNESRLNIATNGDISFYEDTGTTPKLVWKAADERLGIGTDSPTGPLHVAGSDSTVPIKIDNTGTGGNTWRIWSTNDAASDGGGKLGFYNEDTATRAMTLDSSGNVGIGTSSPSNKMSITGYDEMTLGFPSVSGGASRSGIKPTVTGAGEGQLQFLVGGDNITEATTIAAMLDASGNLLVGGTLAFADDATTINSSGLVYASRSGNKSGHFNRQSSDGEIVNFSKDGTTVGSIGTKSNDLTIGTGDTGVQFYDFGNSVVPTNLTTNTNIDATIDLGLSGTRFKDLYLSGGAYLGGTGSANKLDDYEEGTWTPTIVGSTTAGAFTYNIQEGKYTKVGNSVSVNCAIYITATSTSPAGSVKINGLPFTVGNQFPSFAIGWSQFITFTDQLGAYAGATSITLRDTISGGSGSNLQGSAFASAFYIFVSGTYQV